MNQNAWRRTTPGVLVFQRKYVAPRRNGCSHQVFIKVRRRSRSPKIAFQVGDRQQGWRVKVSFVLIHGQGVSIMNLNQPKQITFWIAVILALVALLGQVAIAALAPFAFWILLIAFVLLVLGNTMSGL
jgi:hypothetical protein